jgi:hypothetical protein
MKKQILTAVMATLVSVGAFAQAEGGVGGPGGGNFYKADVFKANLEKILIQSRMNLSKFVTLHKVLNTENTPTGSLIKKLALEGLAQEIIDSKYELKDKCFENKNIDGQIVKIEKDASTLRGVRGAKICLSESRLRQSWLSFNLNNNTPVSMTPYISSDYTRYIENTSDWRLRLEALILHENVRHFLSSDEDDTVVVESLVLDQKEYYHPTSLYFLANRRVDINTSEIFAQLPAEVEKHLVIGNYRQGSRVYYIYDKNKNSTFTLTNTGKNCKKTFSIYVSRSAYTAPHNFSYVKECENSQLVYQANDGSGFAIDLFSVTNTNVGDIAPFFEHITIKSLEPTEPKMSN